MGQLVATDSITFSKAQKDFAVFLMRKLLRNQQTYRVLKADQLSLSRQIDGIHPHHRRAVAAFSNSANRVIEISSRLKARPFLIDSRH